ncbi:MAG: ribosome small subunit-dependent GTPase A [Clostridia bacterium]|nr:ribosome small subunit-dependent GTPase A [Clostridia bacterium]
MEYAETGKIIKVTGGLYTVRLSDGTTPLAGQTVGCRARGNFRHDGTKPLVGDNVTVTYDDSSFTAAPDGTVTPHESAAGLMIAQILPRRNGLIRPPLANLDLMLVVTAAAAPAPDVPTLDKLLCILAYHHIEAVIVIGKAELAPERAAALSDVYTRAGYRTFVLSCRTGEGVPALADAVPALLAGKTTAVAGASGVGKSTLLNTLFPELSLTTGDISQRIARGKNTTRHTELYPLPEPDSYIADTAGFSLLDFEHFDFFDLEDLFDTFPEFAPYVGQCRYTDCTHLKEEGCAIVEAVKGGIIPPSRHQSYRDLYAILKEKHKWDKKE